MTRATQITTLLLLLSADLAKGSDDVGSIDRCDAGIDRCKKAGGISLIQTHSGLRSSGHRSETSIDAIGMALQASLVQHEKKSVSMISVKMVAKEAALSAWLTESAELAKTVKEEEEPADFGDFIFNQKASSDACSARLLEAKKAKDTLSREMLTLTSTIQGHMTVQVTETENLKISAATIKTIKAKNEELRLACDASALEADKEADAYTAELVELRQIANPEVRHEAARDACGCVPQAGWSNGLQTCKPEEKTSPEQAACCEAGLTPHDGDGLAKGATVCIDPKNGEEVAPPPPAAPEEISPKKHHHHAENGGGSLIQQHVEMAKMTKDQCLAFLSFKTARGQKKNKQKKPDERACDEERSQLQAEFNKAYLEISALEKKARARVTGGRQECLDDIDSQLAEALAPMLGSRESSTKRCEAASQAIAQLQPILNSAGDRVKRLKDHLENLKAECIEAGDATEHLKSIRALIYSLEHCPGRNDFQLSVPEVVEEAKDEALGAFDHTKLVNF